MAASVEQTRRLIQQFPPKLRQGIREAPARRVALDDSQGRLPPEMPQMTAQMAQLPMQAMARPDVPLSRSVEDIQSWIDEQFVKINNSIDSDIRQLLLKQLTALDGKIDQSALDQIREGILSIKIKQPEDHSWWHAYSGKIAMSEASTNDLSRISDRIERRAEGIHDATARAWSEIENNLKQLKSKQLERERRLEELEKELQSTLAVLRSNVEQLGLPFGNMIPVRLALFLKVYPVLLLAVVILLFSRMRKMLLIRYELFAVREQKPLIEAAQFDRIYVPWIMQQFVYGAGKSSMSFSLQLMALTFVVFLLPLCMMADITWLFTSYPSGSISGLSYLYIAAIGLLVFCVPILYRRLRTIHQLPLEV